MAATPRRLTADEQTARRARLQAGAEARLERLLQLRDLVLDHLGPGRLLHHLRPGVEQRRPGGDLDRLAGDQPADPAASRSRCPSWPRRIPTAGGIYYWASKLGGPGWGWFTGWFNLIGLVAVVGVGRLRLRDLPASTCSASTTSTSSSTSPRPTSTTPRTSCFALFALILILHGLINVFSSHLVSLFNGISVWWHVVGVAVIVVLLIAVPSHHPSFSLRVRPPDQQLRASATACTGSTCCRSASC